ncbi:hypothetical protein Hanom_Chr09g00806271 [Helianthus anomalus]
MVHVLRENHVVFESLVQEFWKTAIFDALEAEGKGAIVAEIQKKLPAGTVEAILPRLSYEGKYPSLVKKFVHLYWRLLVHMFILCMTENRGGTDQLNISQSAAFVSLKTNQPFNYSN